MRRIVVAVAVVMLLAAPSALADHHLMRVNEVAPAGAQADQFIELRDPASEPFPASREYSVAATDASGTVIAGASQTLEPGPLRTTEPVVIGGANVTARDVALGFAIPAEAARVCFYGDGFQVNCLAYGSGSVPAGQSAQLQSCGAVGVGAPTPGAANTDTGACGGGPPPGGGGGGGGGGGPGGGGEAEDLTPPQQKVGGGRRQDVDSLAVAVTLSEAGRVTVRARVNVPGAAKVIRFRTVTRSVVANTRVRVRLKLARKARRAVKAALADGERLSARVTIAARDTAGNDSTARKRIRLTD